MSSETTTTEQKKFTDTAGNDLELSPDHLATYEKLSKTHKKIHILKVPLEDEKDDGSEVRHAVLFLKAMDRNSYAAISKMSAKDSLRGCELLINTLHIGGDDKKLVTDDFEALNAADFVCGSLMLPRRAQLKKN